MMKPSRRARPKKSQKEKGSDFDTCDLQINTFYGLPVGEENWRVKVIKDRSFSVSQRADPDRATRVIRQPRGRLPAMKPLVIAHPHSFVSSVMKAHWDTQDRLVETSRRARKEYVLSCEAVDRAKQTLKLWTDAEEHF